MPALLVRLTALLGVLALAGCSGGVSREDIRSVGGNLTGIEVTGTPGTAPGVRLAAPLDVDRTVSDIVVEGSGNPVTVDQLFVLHLTLYVARTGDKAISTYDRGRRPMAVKDSDGTLFPALSEAIVGVHEGGRLVMALAAEDGYGEAGAPQYDIGPGDALVVVADVIAVPPVTDTSPAAEPSVPPRALPRRFFDRPEPGELTTTTLVAGDGPEVGRGSLITVRSRAQVWGAPQPFEDSFAKEPALVPIGTGTVVEAWDRALLGVRQGSRVRIVTPARFAFGATGNPPLVPPGSTIVYVIDILGVSGGS